MTLLLWLYWGPGNTVGRSVAVSRFIISVNC
ncbi:unnamed protein product [Onchocerca flexuosa]|uniref:Uncharacterized protein n=1 Tax=Onchocerca flexuosa TaxID=387005 RepID=A0A183HGT2_9BILA|nr:unnamed protein product [Onchocerca flexuosa]